MKKSMKKMVLTGAAVTVMMSFAAPAMADEVQEEQHAGSSNSSVSGIVDEQPFKDPGIRLCDITPTECEISTDPVDDPDHHPVNKDPDIISTDPVDDADQLPVNKDPGTNDDPSTVENPKTGNTPMDEEASASGDVKAEVIPEGLIPAAPKNDDDATSAPKTVSVPNEAGQTADSQTVYGCHNADDVYVEELDVCDPGDETLDFVTVVSGQEPWPDTAGEYVNFLGGINSDLPIMLGVAIQAEGHLIEDFLNWYGEDGGPIGLALQGMGYTIGLGSDVIGGLLEGAGQAADTLHDGLGAVVDAVADAAGDAWDEISSWW